jgi:hypothetical protein
MQHQTIVEESVMSSIEKMYDINTNGITLHVTEQGDGPAVLFCTGFRILPIRGVGR